jgi:hypothetical protein
MPVENLTALRKGESEAAMITAQGTGSIREKEVFVYFEP